MPTSRPRQFRLHVNYFDEPRGRVWTVCVGGRNHYLTHVDVRVPSTTVFRGVGELQPRAWMSGRGVLRITRSTKGKLRIGVITSR